MRPRHEDEAGRPDINNQSSSRRPVRHQCACRGKCGGAEDARPPGPRSDADLKAGVGPDDDPGMTEVEALLSVDAGRAPPGTVVLRLRDLEGPTRRARVVAAVAMTGIAITCAVVGADRDLVAVLSLFAALLGVLATPTRGDTEEVRVKQPTLVVTAGGMIVRDHWGLRSWRFADLAEVRPYLDDRRVGLVLVAKDGSRQFLDNLAFEGGEDLVAIIDQHMRAPSGPA